MTVELRDLPLDTLDDCHAALRTLLRDARPEVRHRALTLVEASPPRALADALVAIALDPDADGYTCTSALRALALLGVALPSPAYRRLLGDACASLERGRTFASLDDVAPSAVVRAACAPHLVEVALAWIEGLAPQHVPRLLDALTAEAEPIEAAVLDALLSRWIDEAPDVLGEHDLRVATRLAGEQPRACALLARHWHGEVLAGRAGVIEAIERAPALWGALRDIPAVTERAREALLGPTGALADALGPMTFARRLRNAVLRWSAHARTPGLVHDQALYARYLRATSHLRGWQHGAVVASQLLRDATLFGEVERDMLSCWRARDRDGARAWLTALPDRARRARLAASLAPQLDGRDLPLLTSAFDAADEPERTRLLYAIDRFRSDAHHTASLRALSLLAEPVGEAARRCLLLRGDEPTLEALRALAREAPAPLDAAHAEALRALSSHTPTVRAHRDLFTRRLAELASTDDEHTAVCLSRALVEALGDEARAPLLRLYFSATHDWVRAAASQALVAFDLLSPS